MSNIRNLTSASNSMLFDSRYIENSVDISQERLELEAALKELEQALDDQCGFSQIPSNPKDRVAPSSASNVRSATVALESFDDMSKEEKEEIRHMLITPDDSHDAWNEFLDELSDSQKELVQSQIDFMVKSTAANSAKGDWPGNLTSYIETLLKPKPPVYDWKKEFRRILGTAFDINRKLTRRKESKRFEDAYGSKLKKKHKILVGIDTSGSVSDKDFQDFFSEIYHIYKAGSQIHVLECDTEITNQYDYDGKMPAKITGRGGTILKPMYDYWNASRDYTLFVLFTDGYCDSPEFLKGNAISIITTGGTEITDFPGKTIKIDRQ